MQTHWKYKGMHANPWKEQGNTGTEEMLSNLFLVSKIIVQ